MRNATIFVTLLLFSCAGPSTEPIDAPDTDTTSSPTTVDETARFTFANRCVLVGSDSADGTRWLTPADDAGYGFTADDRGRAGRFFMKASDLGTYLLYDRDRGYVVGGEDAIARETSLDSDVYLVNDTFVSGAEWELEPSETVNLRYQLRNRRTQTLLSPDAALVDDAADAAVITLAVTTGCTPHPEMSLDATGSVERTTYDDGTLFGYVDTHSHILSNFGFGGGGIFHGAPFHRLGVEVAMGDCELFHGPMGRADLLGYGTAGNGDLDELTLLGVLNTGLLREDAHATDGWPTFSEWPAQTSATHQTQYYRWLERAWMSGLRLMVQHAVSNSVFCSLMGDTGFQPVRWDCNDMQNIDRELEEIHRMEAYIDAQSGGPGKGWLRIVYSPEQARQVIADGKLAIVLGIEVPNLFDCFLTPPEGTPVCDLERVEAQLDTYHDKGVRVLFPNHKFDNAFTPGDGDRGIVELGNFINTGHWANFVQDCPDVPNTFDKGSVEFGGFNKPRDMYLAPAPNELVQLSTEPLRDLLPYLSEVRGPTLEGEWCQKTGLTELGADLVRGIMARGMVLEIDHLPKRSYRDAFAIIEEADYPAAGTHGNTNDWKLYDIGGVSKTGFTRCADPQDPGSKTRRFREHRDRLEAAGQMGAIGFGFDLNGLAGVPSPRFDGSCAEPQLNPVTYPFTSYAGDVTFTEPQMGERVVDFNTEGMIHIGLVPELIEDARRTGATDDDLDILFQSAEAYIRMWEKAEARGEALSGNED